MSGPPIPPDVNGRLRGRCGTCRWWNQWELGAGHCELVRQPNAPVRLSDGGGLDTRIDFGCLWHQPTPKAGPGASAGDDPPEGIDVEAITEEQIRRWARLGYFDDYIEGRRAT